MTAATALQLKPGDLIRLWTGAVVPFIDMDPDTSWVTFRNSAGMYDMVHIDAIEESA